MISLLKSPSLVVLTIVSYFLLSMSACGPTASTAHLDKYDELEFADRAVFNRGFDDTFDAAIHSLQSMGYTIVVSDRSTGLLTAEQETSDVLPEERKAGYVDESPSFWTIVVIVLSILLIVGIVVLLAKGCEGDSESDREQERGRDEGGVHVELGGEDETYRYVLTLNLREIEEEGTEVVVGAARITRDPDTFTRTSQTISNKYINHSVFDAIESHLTEMERRD